MQPLYTVFSLYLYVRDMLVFQTILRIDILYLSSDILLVFLNLYDIKV